MQYAQNASRPCRLWVKRHPRDKRTIKRKIRLKLSNYEKEKKILGQLGVISMSLHVLDIHNKILMVANLQRELLRLHQALVCILSIESIPRDS